MTTRIASKIMLLWEYTLAQKECYPRAEYSLVEEADDESTEQTRNVDCNPAPVFAGKSNRETANPG